MSVKSDFPADHLGGENCSIFLLMSPHRLVGFTARRAQRYLQNSRNVFWRPEVKNRHAEELRSRVTVGLSSGFVYFENLQSRAVENPHGNYRRQQGSEVARLFERRKSERWNYAEYF